MNDPTRSTRSRPDRYPHGIPLPVNEVTNPCPVCFNSSTLQPDWTPPPGFDRRMRQFRCTQGHDSYHTPRHSH